MKTQREINIDEIILLILRYMKTDEFIALQNRNLTLNIPPNESVYRIEFDENVVNEIGICNLEFITLEHSNNEYINSHKYNFVFNLNVMDSFFMNEKIIIKHNKLYSNFYITLVNISTDLKSLNLKSLTDIDCIFLIDNNISLNHINIYMKEYRHIYKINGMNKFHSYYIDLSIFNNCTFYVKSFKCFLATYYYLDYSSNLDVFIKLNNKIIIKSIELNNHGLFHKSIDLKTLFVFFKYSDVYLDYKSINKKFVYKLFCKTQVNIFKSELEKLSSYKNLFKTIALVIEVMMYDGSEISDIIEELENIELIYEFKSYSILQNKSS